MLRRDFSRQAHIIQPTKKRNRPTSILTSPHRALPDIGDITTIVTPTTSGQNPNIKQYKPIQTPQSDISNAPSIVFSVSSTNYQNTHELHFDYSPSIMDFTEQERSGVFVSRVRQCFLMCNFQNPDIKDKIEDKTNSLTDILNSLKRTNMIENFGNEEYQYAFRLFLLHTNRQAPNNSQIYISMIDADVNSMQIKETAWDHISIVYDIMLELITSRKFNQRLCKQSQLRKLSYSIVNMFSSPDAREREKLSKLFHHCYVILVNQRSLIRKYTNDFLSDVLQNLVSPIGVNDLLNSYLPIASGFKVPLMNDHLITYKKIILPLHKSPFLQRFHVGLVHVITTFCEKQRSLAYTAIEYVLSIWPQTISSKETNLLLEIGHLVEICGGDVPKDTILNICNRIAKCANSPVFTLCERTMMMWQSDCWAKSIASYAPETFRILLPALFKTVKLHWCEDVRKLTMSTIVALKQSNQGAFDLVGSEMKALDSDRINSEVERVNTWKSIAKQANIPKEELSDVMAKLQNLTFS